MEQVTVERANLMLAGAIASGNARRIAAAMVRLEHAQEVADRRWLRDSGAARLAAEGR